MGDNKNDTRRGFITRTGAAAAAGSLLFDIVPSRALGLQGQTPPSDTINFGHIGIGGRGRGFLRPEANIGKAVPASSNLGGDGSRIMRPARSIALCDVDTGRLDKAASLVGGKPRLYKDFRRLLEDRDVDAVYIASPDHWHALQTIMACEAGKDVYVEKPASNTIEEGRAMVAAAERYGRVVQVGSQGRSQMGAWQANNYIKAGRIGTVRKVLCWHYASPEGDWTPDAAPPPELDYEMWVGPARWLPYNEKHTHGAFRWLIDFGGGQIRDRGAHVFNLASWVLGLDDKWPHRVTATGTPPPSGMYDCPQNFEVTIEYKDPELTLVWSQPGVKKVDYDFGATYYGTKGELLVRGGDGEFCILEDNGRSPSGVSYVVENRHLALADDDQPLLLGRVEPADEDVRAHPVREAQVRDGRIGDARLQITVPDGRDRHVHRELSARHRLARVGVRGVEHADVRVDRPERPALAGAPRPRR